MWRRVSQGLLVLALVATGCADGGDDPPDTIAAGQGAATAVEAVNELVEALNAAEFASASRLAMPDQAALASLAEGATLGAVAEALREGDQEVAANFWAGFAQGSGAFLSDTDGASDGDVVEEAGVEFHTVNLSFPSGESRVVLVREQDGFRVDIFASFGAGLADKMAAPVERLLTTQTDDARLVLASLGEIVPSLLVAAGQPENSAEVTQQLLALVELITRVG